MYVDKERKPLTQGGVMINAIGIQRLITNKPMNLLTYKLIVCIAYALHLHNVVYCQWFKDRLLKEWK